MNTKSNKNNRSQKERTIYKKNGKKKTPMSIAALRYEIEGYGFTFKITDFFKTLIIALGLIIAGAVFYHLNIIGTGVLIIAGILVTPLMVIQKVRYIHEEHRFRDITEYIQQMIYCFMKKPKIRECLVDTAMTLEGRQITETIKKAIEYMDNTISNNVLEESLAIIEKEYGCNKLSQLHEFIIKVEKSGGQYENTIMVLLRDVQAWDQRTYDFQLKRKKVKTNVLLSMGMSIVLAGVLTQYLPEDYTIIHHIVYQISSFVFLAAMLAIFVISDKLISGSWLSDKGYRKDKEIVRDYQTVTFFNYKREFRHYLMYVIPIFILAALALIIFKQPKIAGVLAICGVYYLTQPKRKYRHAKKRLEEDIKKCFPVWLRSVSISLQTETVQNAIKNSFDDAPTVLKPALDDLIKGFTEDPIDIKPWNEFLQNYDVPDIKSATKMFYAIDQLGDEEQEKQINVLIERNNKLLQTSEELREESALSTLGYFVAVPMVLSMPKLVIDMVLLFMNFINLMSTIDITI